MDDSWGMEDLMRASRGRDRRSHRCGVRYEGGLVLALVLCGFAGSSKAQGRFPEDNGSVLRGVRAVDGQVVIAMWPEGIVTSEASFREASQRVFELGLRRAGLRVEASTPNYLICEVSAIKLGELRNVAYMWRVKYFTTEPMGPHRLMWELWGIGYREISDFKGEWLGQECVDTFEGEWLKWNPK